MARANLIPSGGSQTRSKLGLRKGQKTALSGPNAKRRLESRAGAMRRASRSLRRKGFSKGAEQLAVAAELEKLDATEKRGSSIRSAHAEFDRRDAADTAGRIARGVASGVGYQGVFGQQKEQETPKGPSNTSGATSPSFDGAKETMSNITNPGKAGATPGQAPGAGGPSTPGGAKPVNEPTAPAAKPATPPTTSPTTGQPTTTGTSPVPDTPTSPAGPNTPAGASPQTSEDTRPVQGPRDNKTGDWRDLPEGPEKEKARAEIRARVDKALEEDTRPIQGPQNKPKREEGRISGLRSGLANEIAEDRADISTRASRLMQMAKDSGLTMSRQEAEEGLREQLFKRQRKQILEELRREGNEELARSFDRSAHKVAAEGKTGTADMFDILADARDRIARGEKTPAYTDSTIAPREAVQPPTPPRGTMLRGLRQQKPTAPAAARAPAIPAMNKEALAIESGPDLGTKFFDTSVEDASFGEGFDPKLKTAGTSVFDRRRQDIALGQIKLKEETGSIDNTIAQGARGSLERKRLEALDAQKQLQFTEERDKRKRVRDLIRKRKPKSVPATPNIANIA